MAGKSAALENGYLQLLFKGVAIANIADNTATSPLTNLYVALHTADPTDAGTQTSNEISYTGYSRVAVARGAGWTVTASSVSPAANIDFGQCTVGTGTVTHWSVGSLASGAGVLYYSGTVTPNISVQPGVIPRLTTSSTVTES